MSCWTLKRQKVRLCAAAEMRCRSRCCRASVWPAEAWTGIHFLSQKLRSLLTWCRLLMEGQEARNYIFRVMNITCFMSLKITQKVDKIEKRPKTRCYCMNCIKIWERKKSQYKYLDMIYSCCNFKCIFHFVRALSKKSAN